MPQLKIKVDEIINERKNEEKLQKALHLIKIYITEEKTQQNVDLHNAIQLIVDVARKYDYLLK